MRSFLRLGAVMGVLGLIAGVLLVLPAASVGDPADDAPISAAFHGKSQNGVYIVRLRELPAVAYDGSISGLAATKPEEGPEDRPEQRGRDEVRRALERGTTPQLKAVGAARSSTTTRTASTASRPT